MRHPLAALLWLSGTLAVRTTGGELRTFEPQLPAQWRHRVRYVATLAEGNLRSAYKYQVSCSSAESFVVIKIIKDVKIEYSAERELRMMRRMRNVSAHCISTVGNPDAVVFRGRLYIMMPFLGNGSLFDLLRSCQHNLACKCAGRRLCWNHNTAPVNSEGILMALLYQVAEGLAALHLQGLTHMDMKPQNVMINCRNQSCYATVIDLGFACEIMHCDKSGTRGYAAPEVWARQGVGHPLNDVFGLGAVMYVLLYGRPPPFYGDRNGQQTLAYDPAKDMVLPPAEERDDADQLVIDMLQTDITERVLLSEVLQRLRALVRKSGDPKAKEMLQKDPGTGEDAVPKCLLAPQEYEDIRSREATVQDCVDTLRPAARPFHCGICLSDCGECCKCRVLKNGEFRKVYFRQPSCPLSSKGQSSASSAEN